MKRVMFLVAGMIVLSQSLSAFAVVNQTDKDRVVILQEASRPPPARYPGWLEMPVAVDPIQRMVRVPAHKLVAVDLEPCSVLLVHMVEWPIRDGIPQESHYASCYEPYSVGQPEPTSIENDWGLVIYDPAKSGSAKEGTWPSEYDIRLVHPEFVGAVMRGEMPRAVKKATPPPAVVIGSLPQDR